MKWGVAVSLIALNRARVSVTISAAQLVILPSITLTNLANVLGVFGRAPGGMFIAWFTAAAVREKADRAQDR